MTLRPVSTVAIRGLSTTATSDTVAVDARDPSDRPLGAIVTRIAAMIVVAQSRTTGAAGRVHRGTATTTTMPLRGASATVPKMSVLIDMQMSPRGATSR